MIIHGGIINRAYVEIREKFGVHSDTIASDIKWQIKLIERCFEIAGQPSPFTIPKRLINIRKVGNLPTKNEGAEILFETEDR